MPYRTATAINHRRAYIVRALGKQWMLLARSQTEVARRLGIDRALLKDQNTDVSNLHDRTTIKHASKLHGFGVVMCRNNAWERWEVFTTPKKDEPPKMPPLEEHIAGEELFIGDFAKLDARGALVRAKGKESTHVAMERAAKWQLTKAVRL